jgi:3-deoxy-D-manno-octulosonate 8-phosphate phosphatase (KDO 8-P phosphatase)
MNLLEKFRKIRCFVFDVDGVLTDGTILLLDDGQMARSMNVKDGYAMQLAVKKGYTLAIISGGVSESAKNRLQKLGISETWFGVTDKRTVLTDIISRNGIAAEHVLYMGDDIPDLDVMRLSGLPCCPADAVPEAKQASVFIASAAGGKGCVREVIEKVLKLNGHWEANTHIASK